MKFIITGGTGHIGNNLARFLIKNNHQVKLLLRRNNDPSINDIDCEKVVGDLFSYEFLLKEIETDSIVIHSAGLIDIENKDVESLQEVNFDLTVKITQACIEKQIKKFIYISSTDAINQMEGTIEKVDSFDLEGLEFYYGITKAMASDYVLKCLNNKLLDGVIIIPSAVLGINDYKGSSQGIVIKDAYKKKICITTKGHYNFIDVEYLVEAIYQASIKDCDKTYIISGVDCTIKELYQTIFKVQGKKYRAIYIPGFIVRIFVPLISLYYKLSKKKPLFTKMVLKTINEKRTFSNKYALLDLELKNTNLEDLIYKTNKWFLENNK